MKGSQRLIMLALAVLGLAVLGLAAACTKGESSVQVDQVVDESVGTKIGLRFSHVFLIKAGDGFVLVDAATSGAVGTIKEAMENQGIAPSEIRLILVTHAHKEHFGGLKELSEYAGAPVMCHKDAAAFLRAGESEPVIARNWLGRTMNALLPEIDAYPVDPDYLVEDGTISPTGG